MAELPDNDAHFRVLLVEDDEATRRFMRAVLKSEGYETIEAEHGQAALDLLDAEDVDLILSDVMMPGMDGIELCKRVKGRRGLEMTPVILCTALTEDADRLRGLEAGADDFLTKPVKEAELRARLRNSRRLVMLQSEVGRAKEHAEELVEQRTEELRRTIERLEIARAEAAIAQLDVIHRLAAATEYKDSDTGAHIQRIAEYSLVLARCLGWYDDNDAVILSQAATMHDLGKIGIPDYILMKPGLLTTEEFEEMKNHTILGWRLLSGSHTPLLQTGARIARSHHEKWDGSGYPDGLASEKIPSEARIVAVADVFDALRAQRCYKPEYPLDQCFEMIHTRAGQHFDPEVVEAFMICRDDLAKTDIGLAGESAPDCESDAA